MLTYVTSNSGKIRTAKRYLSRYGIAVEMQHLDMIEIQSHSGEEILTRKAEQAYEFLKQPLIVSDHFWSIPALRGFPGAYMKYINEWLTPQDFLQLMQPYSDRAIFIEEFLMYVDGENKKLFSKKIKGQVLHEIKGKDDSFRSIVSLRKDGMSIAQCWENDIDSVDSGHPLWDEFAGWYKNK